VGEEYESIGRVSLHGVHTPDRINYLYGHGINDAAGADSVNCNFADEEVCREQESAIPVGCQVIRLEFDRCGADVGKFSCVCISPVNGDCVSVFAPYINELLIRAMTIVAGRPVTGVSPCNVSFPVRS